MASGNFAEAAAIAEMMGWGAAFSAANAAWVDDPEANQEWQDYKDRYREPPPDLDECELLKWKLAREERLLQDRMAWDNKWMPGRHDDAMQQTRNAINNLKKKIKRVCKEECP